MFLNYYYKDKSNNNDLKNKCLLFILWFAIPIFIPLLIALVFPESFAFGPVRYVLFATPPYYILISKSIVEFDDKKLSKLMIGNYIKSRHILLLILLFSIIPIYAHYINYDEGQYREAADYLAAKANKGDYVIVHGAPTFLPFNYYYSKYPKSVSFYRSFSIDDLKKFASSKDEFWAVFSMLKYYDPKNEFKQYADNNFAVVQKKEFMFVEVVKYKRK